jgi:8-oxo-dGTP pyrophosphatase MutT (NUDIX family)
MKQTDKSYVEKCFAEELGRALSLRDKKSLPVNGLTTAAVLVPVFSIEDRLHILLTKRSEFVEHHKGEISFPGGKLDDEDPDMLSCALRETSEEIGIEPEQVRVIGELDDFYTVATGFLVVPFVGLIPYPCEFRTSVREIADVLSVPMEIFFDETRRSESDVLFQGQAVKIISYRWKGHNIWGATARIMKHFTEILSTLPFDCLPSSSFLKNDGT